jgi:hypothetical protein
MSAEDRSNEKEVLKIVLEPLLEDFQYWFARSRSFLESEEISFFTKQEQDLLLERVKQSQQEVNTAKMLFRATDGEVGIDLSTIAPWHQLVSECWQVAMRWRSMQKADS